MPRLRPTSTTASVRLAAATRLFVLLGVAFACAGCKLGGRANLRDVLVPDEIGDFVYDEFVEPIGGKIYIEQAADEQRVFKEKFPQIYAREFQNQAGASLHAFPNYEVLLFNSRLGIEGDFAQFIRIRTLWPYVSGRTHSTDSRLNCIVDYAVIGPRGSLLYQGAGMVHVVPAGPGFWCDLKAAQLGLTRRTGEADDVFGNCTISGTFDARSSLAEFAYYDRRFAPVIALLKNAPAPDRPAP